MISRRALGLGLAGLACAHDRREGPHLAGFLGSLPRQTATGAPFDPSTLEGRVVLITFVATWCFPCLTDLVTVDRLERDWAPAGFSSILVGMDLEGALVLEPFARGYKITSPVLLATEEIRGGQSPFGRLRELPSRLLFGRDGALVVGFSGVSQYEDLERLVRDELARKP